LYTHFLLAAPLFATVLIGYLIARAPFYRRELTGLVTKFVFAVPLPALLFLMMSDLSALPSIDARLLLAFFGSCLLVFVLGRLVGAFVFGMDGTAQSVFALGGIFSNNVLLGLPLAKTLLGPRAVPCVALIVVFNSLTLWTLVTVSVEWARHGALTLAGFGRTALSVLTNPVVASILAGIGFGMSGLHLPAAVAGALAGLGRLAGPSALLALGLSLTEHDVRREWRASAAICLLKLVVSPLCAWALARALGLPPLETSVVVLLASISVGANVYLMAAQFETLEGTVASSLVLSTVLAAFTTPALLTLLQASQ
jgi:predicted permease